MVDRCATRSREHEADFFLQQISIRLHAREYLIAVLVVVSFDKQDFSC
jgi:hypothetical protein